MSLKLSQKKWFIGLTAFLLAPLEARHRKCLPIRLRIGLLTGLAVFLFFSPVAFADTTSTLRPIADGGEDSALWKKPGNIACNTTDCYLQVNESSGTTCTNSDGDTTFIEGGDQNINQTFDIDEASIPDNSVVTAILVTACYRSKVAGQANTFQTRRCVNATCNSSGTDGTSADAYTESTQSHTGLSITKTATTDIEIGASITGASGAKIRISQISAVITYTPPDTTAPSAVSNLALSSPSNSAMTVSWTAPGDDGLTGTATSYDLRYSTSAITSGNFSSATQVTGEPTPSVAGSSESMSVTGLSPSTTYYFAIKTSDEVPNTSAISNVPNLATTATPDTTAPAAISNLALSSPSNSAMTVSWTAPGDDGSTGTATNYDLRYSTSNITSGNFSSATQVSGEPTPLVAGTSQSMTVTGLSPSITYYFAIKTSDEVPNTSAISNVPSLATLAAGSGGGGDSGGGGGGSGSVAPRSVVFSGQAYPNSKIEVLRKSRQDEIYKNVPAEFSNISADGAFYINYTGLLGGDYLFALRAEDKDGRKTGVMSFGQDLLTSDRLEIKDIFFPPTVSAEKASVVRGSEVKIVGYAAPRNKLELEIDGIIKMSTVSDDVGYYALATSSPTLGLGEHRVKGRQIDKSGKVSDFSSTTTFKISLLAIPKADFNGDNMVNVTDWSVFLFRWSSKDEKLKSKIDLNGDGKIDIADLSIFLSVMKIK